MGMTMAEKVLAGAAGRGAVNPGKFVTAAIDVLIKSVVVG